MELPTLMDVVSPMKQPWKVFVGMLLGLINALLFGLYHGIIQITLIEHAPLFIAAYIILIVPINLALFVIWWRWTFSITGPVTNLQVNAKSPIIKQCPDCKLLFIPRLDQCPQCGSIQENNSPGIGGALL
ncbi:MAG: hypothetical protein RBG13Loki_3244 [Promethearchaeota archaeon CR_4]|nr:MAG: hypothetical protein RBG13Loki_3244 [Candidatus Lokiarchaeota archaeon CR_4]